MGSPSEPGPVREDSMECIVSIVIPFYCTPKSLFLRCMASILSADLACIEIIVVDDGSPEAYQPMLASCEKLETVRVFHIPNSGVSAARNRGIREARGKWIMFVDSDDYVDTEALKEAVEYARDHQGDVVVFSGGRDTGGGICYNTTFLQPGINYAEKESDRISIMESALAVGVLPQGYVQYFTLGSPCSKLLRTAFLRENALSFDTSVKLAEDVLFALHVYQAAQSIVYEDLLLYFYVFNPMSATNRYRPGFSADMDVFFARVKAFMTRFHLEKELERAYYIRAQFEVKRSIKLDFSHPDNQDPGAIRAYRRLVAKEPYRTAMRPEYLLNNNLKGRLKLAMVRHGWFGLKRKTGRLHAFFLRLFRK